MNIDLIGAPMDFGAGRRGVDMGPSAIRYAGLRRKLEQIGHQVIDRGNVDVPLRDVSPERDAKLRYADSIRAVARRLADRVAATLHSDRAPLVLGGDHSLSMGTISGAARDRNVGVLWIDAHGDFNTTDTTPSGNIHGMPLAALAGFGDARILNLGAQPPRATVNPANIAIVGARNLDPGERTLLKEAGVAVFATELIDRIGMHAAMGRAIDVVTRGTDGIYLSFDLDALDPLYAPGVGTPAPGGITYREAHLACELIAETKQLIGADFVEVNPILDERNKTAIVAVSLALSAFGKRVWQ